MWGSFFCWAFEGALDLVAVLLLFLGFIEYIVRLTVYFSFHWMEDMSNIHILSNALSQKQNKTGYYKNI